MRGSLCLVAGLFILGLSACAGSVDGVTSPSRIAIPADWRGASDAVAVDPVRYWTVFNDPLLDEFIAKATAANRDLAFAGSRIALARAGVRASRANTRPQLSGVAGVQRDVGDFANDDLQFSAGLDAQWEVDLFGRIARGIDASRAELAAAGYALGDVRRLIVGQVAQTTIAARTLAAQRAISRDTLRIQDENLQIARWRLQAGLVSSFDVEQARAQRAQTAAVIPAIERDLAQAANAISVLTGEAPGPVLDALLGAPAPIPAPPEVVGFSIPAEALRQRPDVRQAEALLVADTARIDVARAQLLPMVRLTGNIGTASFGLSGLFDLVTGGLFAGLSQLVYDGGRARAEIDSAQAMAAGSLAQWEQSILPALADVENAAVALRTARERVVALAEAEDAAQNAAVLARSQYQAGLTDFQTLLLTENQLLSARNAITGAQAERANAFVALQQATGGGWDPQAAAQTAGSAGRTGAQ